MKRATLTAYPANPPSEPADLTDRLLEREESPSDAPAAKRRRGQPRANPAGQKANAARPKAKAARPKAKAAQPAPAPAASSLEAALAAADSATETLRQAAREAPARYDVALRYRLDALAHHLQQVKEFVTSLAAR